MQFSAFERFRLLSGLAPVEIASEEQSSDYQSGRVQTVSGLWRIRTARVTPTKPGAFVAAWKRGEGGETEPFGLSDACDGLMVFVEDGAKFGVFRFTQAHLEALGVVQSTRSAGKRGFRVYPAWCESLNAHAAQVQRAQAVAFTELLRESSP